MAKIFHTGVEGARSGANNSADQPANAQIKRKRRSHLNLKDSLHKAEVEQRLRLQKHNAAFVRWAFACSLFVTLGAYVCQGFHQFTGFQLSDQSLNWLGAATIGQIAGLLAIVIRQK
jgi:hypothetical protein